MAASGSELVTINQLKQSNANIKSSVSYMPPVGYVYISYSSTSPASIYGGQWTQLKSVFPYFTTNVQPGGANSKTLTLAQMPKHRHGLLGWNWLMSDETASNEKAIIVGSDDTGHYTAYSGSTSSINFMPAYQGLYAWRRTA